jgi:carbohydrate kinase (thermoresistant glucokinase family)
MVIFIMGVSGCGKTTVGRMLSEQTGIPFYDADDFHPQANIDKMSRGEPLTDADRASWLQMLSDHLQVCDRQGGAVLACSALKEKYRRILSQNLEKQAWVMLTGSFDLIYDRIRHREDHYMGASLLESQFDTLEIPDYGIHIDIELAPEEIVEKIIEYYHGS